MWPRDVTPVLHVMVTPGLVRRLAGPVSGDARPTLGDFSYASTSVNCAQLSSLVIAYVSGEPSRTLQTSFSVSVDKHF